MAGKEEGRKKIFSMIVFVEEGKGKKRKMHE